MAENIKHFPVNWIEGMKINKNHFVELQDNIEDLVRDARNLEVNELNFGLMSTNLTSPFQYSISIDAHNELSVEIKMLKAVTPSGGRIEITDYTGSFSEKMELKDFDVKENNYYLMLNVDPYHRVTLGEQNMNEIPPRFPNVISKYYLTNVVESEVNQNKIGSLQFPLAKFKTSADNYEILTNYIPPCLTVNSHPRLISLFENYDKLFKDLEFSTLQIIKKIKFRNSNDDENVIADMVQVACDKTLQYVEQHITRIKWTNLHTKPVTIFENIVNLARILKNCFDTFSGDGKEMLFNYFSEWTDSKSGDFERLFLDVINIKYKSFDIEEMVNQVLFFNSKIDALFTILNQLDYIGKKRDTGIFVNENVLKNEKIGSSIFGTDNKNDVAPSSSPSFLAD
jgi:predicted component of type VI protein secretion system